jgi:2-oxoglutarate dehydrogenase E2 component (dihydrolipoamide succinyltransferase)
MTTAVEIRAPAEQTEGTRSQILRWLKSVGDSVTENEPLIEIETDKVTVEVAAPGSGTLREIFKQEQEEIGPGDLLGRIEAAGNGAAAGMSVPGPSAVLTDTGGAERPAAAAGTARGLGPAAMPGASAGLGSSAASGTAPQPGPVAMFGASMGLGSSATAGIARGAGHSVTSGAEMGVRPSATSDAQAVTSAHLSHRDVASHISTANSQLPPQGSDMRAAPMARALSPAVRRLLAERGLDSASVRGTGEGGRITVADVLEHANTGVATAKAQAREPAPVKSLEPNPTPEIPGSSHRVPHTAVRKRIAEHMVQSLLHTAPHVTTVFEADMSAALEHRRRNKDEFAQRGVPLTLTAYFLQAAVAAIRAVPEANSRWTDTALEIHDSMHIGVATALDTGLVVPVLRDVQSLNLFETARGLEQLVSRAREGRLSPADVRGGTFTISNHGVSGSLVATPIIINQPQSAILGVGKLEKRAVVVCDEGADHIVIQPRCYVTLTIDHRVMDGHQANRFLQTFVERLATLPAE